MECLFLGAEMSTRCLWLIEALSPELLLHYIAGVRTSFCRRAALNLIIVHLPARPPISCSHVTSKIIFLDKSTSNARRKKKGVQEGEIEIVVVT